MQRIVWAMLLVVVAKASAAGQMARDGEVVGRLTEIEGAALPGVRVAVSSGDERWLAITDNEGRFAVRLPKLGTYHVATELPGFFSRSGTITLTPTIRRAHIAWRLEVGCIEEGIRVILGPREAAPLTDAIVHVRVRTDDGPLVWSRRPECPGRVVRSYTVEVLRAVVRRRGRDDGRKMLQILLSSHEDRLTPAAEYVALLWPESVAGEGLVFPVVSGRVVSVAGGLLSGMRVEEALEALRQWSREGRPRR